MPEGQFLSNPSAPQKACSWIDSGTQRWFAVRGGRLFRPDSPTWLTLPSVGDRVSCVVRMLNQKSITERHPCDAAAVQDLLGMVAYQRSNVSPVGLWRRERNAEWTLDAGSVGTSGKGTMPLKLKRMQ